VSETAAVRGEHAPGLLAEARAAFAAWVRAGGAAGRGFLEVRVRSTPDGRFALSHLSDGEADPATLRRLSDPYAARDIAQTTAAGEHRPLKTAPNLRRGWLLEGVDERGLWTALDYLYPACVAHWHAGRLGGLRVTPWSATAGRQSGMYASVRLLAEPAVRDAVRACCGDGVCLRQVAWGLDESRPEPLDASSPLDASAASPSGEDVPCPEACSMFTSFARAVLQVERKPRLPVAGLGELNEPELEQLRALLESAARGPTEEIREGEFDDPLNRRRLRYLALRIGGVPRSGEAGDS